MILSMHIARTTVSTFISNKSTSSEWKGKIPVIYNKEVSITIWLCAHVGYNLGNRAREAIICSNDRKNKFAYR